MINFGLNGWKRMTERGEQMRKKLRMVFLLLIALCAAVFAGFSYFLGSQVVAGSTQLVTPESTSGVKEAFWKSYDFDLRQFTQTYHIEKVEITSSFDGHTIPADYLYRDEKDRDTVIMVHGLGGNRLTNYPVAELFLSLGYNVITYDQRSSNENTADKTTFGYWEKYDLLDYIAYVKETVPDRKIGVWGTSFGGATAVQALAYQNTGDEIAFLILDCPVSDMRWMVDESMRQMGDLGIPVSYLSWCGDIVNRIKLGFSYHDADAAAAADRIRTPALVINSKADDVTPYFMGKDIYDRLGSEKKEIWTLPDSEHTGMWMQYNAMYRQKVTDFISRADA